MVKSLFACAVSTLLLTTTVLADWPIFRGDALMTGVGSARLPDQLDEKWTFKAGDTIEGAPVVVAGVVYFASLDKHLYALELATGKQKWKVKLGPAKASPSVKGDRVYLGDLDGKFYCVNTADGKVVWTFEAEQEIQASANFHGNNIIFGSHDSTLYCLNPEGKKVWDTKVDGPINAAAAVAGDRTFATGCSDGILHVIDATNGKELGNIDLGGQAVATAAVVDDRVYLSMVSNQVVAADLKSMKRVWAFEAPKRQMPFYSSAAAVNGVWFKISNPVIAELRNARVPDGVLDKLKPLLDKKLSRDEFLKELARLLSVNEVKQYQEKIMSQGSMALVVAGSRDKKIYALNAKTGEEVWNFVTDGQVDASPVVVGERVYVGCLSSDGNFYVLDLKTGKKIQELNLDTAVTGSVGVGPDCLLVGTDKGTLYCLGKK